jgi:hypothetical protein
LEVVVSLLTQERDLAFCNSLKFGFTVHPYYSFMDSFAFPELVQLNSTALVNPSFSYDGHLLTLSYEFTEDMVLVWLTIVQNATLMLSYTNYTFLFSPSSFQVSPDNNVPANFLDAGMCSEKQSFE